MMFTLLGLAFAVTPYDAILGTRATTAADEYALGKEYIAANSWYFGEWRDPAQVARAERITRQIVAASDRPDLVVNVVVVDNPEVNASAFPGGFLLLNRGLLRLLDDDQLAFVIGHEISHVILRHNAAMSNIRDAGEAVVALQAARVADDRTSAEQRMEDLFLMTATHSRQLELEADLYGLLYSLRAGYPGQASRTALAKVEASFKVKIPDERRPWMSHPLTADRLDELQKGIDGILRVEAEFDVGRTHLAAGRSAEAAASFEQFLTIFPQSSAGWTNLGAAWLAQESRAAKGPVDALPIHQHSGVSLRGIPSVTRERARAALTRALSLDPEDPVALTLTGALARREGELAVARTLLTRAVEAWPDAAAPVVNLGNVCAAEGDEAGAIDAWTRARALDPSMAEPRVNLARAWAGQEKRRDEVIALWEGLVGDPWFGAEARGTLEHLRPRAPVAINPVGEGAIGPLLGAVGLGGIVAVASGGPLKAGMPHADLTLQLGAPDVAESRPESGFTVMIWFDAGVQALVRGDLVDDLSFTSEQIQVAGVGPGSPEEQVLAGFGPPSRRTPTRRGAILSWPGITVVTAGGRVVSMSLTRQGT